MAPPCPLAGHHGAQHTHTVLCLPTPTKMPCRVTGTNTFPSVMLALGAHGSSSSRFFASSKRKQGWENYGDCGCSADGRHGRQEPSQPLPSGHFSDAGHARAGLVSHWKDFQPPHFLSFPSVVFLFLPSEIQPQRSLSNLLHICTHRGTHTCTHTHTQTHSYNYSQKWALGNQPQRLSPARKNVVLDPVDG